jgi:hypothetical protein
MSAVYVTIDRWESRDAWMAFHDAHRAAYDALDKECENLTTREEPIGDYVDRVR